MSAAAVRPAFHGVPMDVMPSRVSSREAGRPPIVGALAKAVAGALCIVTAGFDHPVPAGRPVCAHPPVRSGCRRRLP